MPIGPKILCDSQKTKFQWRVLCYLEIEAGVGGNRKTLQNKDLVQVWYLIPGMSFYFFISQIFMFWKMKVTIYGRQKSKMAPQPPPLRRHRGLYNPLPLAMGKYAGIARLWLGPNQLALS